MKLHIRMLLAALLSFYFINAQTTTLPAQGSEKQKLADITVPSIELISAVKDDSQKAYIINVKIEIKNTGQVVTPAFILIGQVSKGNTWNTLENNFTIQSMKAASSKTVEYKFMVPYLLQTGNQFNFRIMADKNNAVKESNENNNSSVGILIGL